MIIRILARVIGVVILAGVATALIAQSSPTQQVMGYEVLAPSGSPLKVVTTVTATTGAPVYSQAVSVTNRAASGGTRLLVAFNTTATTANPGPSTRLEPGEQAALANTSIKSVSVYGETAAVTATIAACFKQAP